MDTLDSTILTSGDDFCSVPTEVEGHDEVTAMLIDPTQIQFAQLKTEEPETKHIPMETVLEVGDLSNYAAQSVTLGSSQPLSLMTGQSLTLGDGHHISLGGGQQFTIEDGQQLTLDDGQQYLLITDPGCQEGTNSEHPNITTNDQAETLENALEDTQFALVEGLEDINSDSQDGITLTRKLCLEQIGDAFVITMADEGSDESEEIKPMVPKPRPKPKGKPAAQNGRSEFGANTDVTQNWFTTTDDKVLLQKSGVAWRRGQWSRDEVELLKQNIEKYCNENHIGDPTQIIFEMSKDDRKDFYRSISVGLQRPLFSVYRRVIRMYDKKNYRGKYTQEELHQLKQLRMQYGNDWSAIGAAMGRSASSVKDRCRLIKETCHSGKWFDEEEERLILAVREHSGTKYGESVTSGISWADVADKVATRSEKQCRTKWLNYLNWKQTGGRDWTRENDQQLILKIESLAVSEEAQVNWEDLASQWDCCRSPQWLRSKWWLLKRHISEYQKLGWKDLVEKVKELHLSNRTMYIRKNDDVSSNNNATNKRIQNILANNTEIQIGDSTFKTEDCQSINIGPMLDHDLQSGSYLITQSVGDFTQVSLTNNSTEPGIILQGLQTQHNDSPVVIGDHSTLDYLSSQLQLAQVITAEDSSTNIGEVLPDDVGVSLDVDETTLHTQLQTIQTDHNFANTAILGDGNGTAVTSDVIMVTGSTDPSVTSDLSSVPPDLSAVPSDLVMVTTAPTDAALVTSTSDTTSAVTSDPLVLAGSHHDYAQSEAVDGYIPVHMCTLSDPMLNSDTPDLICSSDHEDDKVSDV